MNQVRTSRDDPWQSLHKHFSGQTGERDNWTGAGLALAALLALLLGLRLVLRLQHRLAGPRERRQPYKLFRELLTKLPINGGQQALLRRMARDLALRAPAQMLLSPASFTAVVQRWLRLTKVPMQRHVGELDAIAEALFPRPEGDSPHTAPAG